MENCKKCKDKLDEDSKSGYCYDCKHERDEYCAYCPYCGVVKLDSYKLDEGKHIIECEQCKKEFELEIEGFRSYYSCVI